MAQHVVDAVNNQHDKTKLTSLKCANAEHGVQAAIDNVGHFTNMKLTGLRTTTGNQAVANVALNTDSRSETGSATMEDQNGKWCWKSVGGSSGNGSSSKAAQPGTDLSTESLTGDGGFGIGTLTGKVAGGEITLGSIGTDDAPSGGACVDLFTVI